MVGNSAHNDRTFDPDIYEEFYSDHHFQPLAEEDAFNAHEVIPRFGWGFDKIKELQDSREKPLRVLDLGCLDGSFALTIAKHLGCKVTGVDLTKDGIEIATRRSLKADLPAIFFQGAIEDFLKQAAEDGAVYDVVTWFEIIEHVKDVQLCVDLIDAVVSSEGTILCSTPAFESPHFGMDDEDNKCHIRLFTMKNRDYTAVNKYGNTRKATSFPQLLGNRIQEMGTYSELINVMYK